MSFVQLVYLGQFFWVTDLQIGSKTNPTGFGAAPHKKTSSGELSGGFSFGIGEVFGHATTSWGQFAVKTVAHGVSGGIQSAAFGGDFGSGFLAGSVGHGFGEWGSRFGDAGGVIASAASAGTVSALSGGNFWQGAQTGAYQYLFNRMGEVFVHPMSKAFRQILRMDYDTTPEEVYEKAGSFGPDALGIVGSGLRLFPHPLPQGVGSSMIFVGSVWGGYNIYKSPDTLNTVLGLRGLYSPHPVFGITVGSASMLYNAAK